MARCKLLKIVNNSSPIVKALIGALPGPFFVACLHFCLFSDVEHSCLLGSFSLFS